MISETTFTDQALNWPVAASFHPSRWSRKAMFIGIASNDDHRKDKSNISQWGYFYLSFFTSFYRLMRFTDSCMYLSVNRWKRAELGPWPALTIPWFVYSGFPQSAVRQPIEPFMPVFELACSISRTFSPIFRTWSWIQVNQFQQCL